MIRTVFLFLISLIVIFALGFSVVGFSYNATCPRCEGTGVSVWHAGSPCSICGGSGQISMLSSISFALILFVGFISTFLGFFGFGYYTLLRQLKRNPWVKDVEKMGFWFDQRPQVRFTRGIYWTWLFYHDRNKWAKLTTIGISAGAIFFVSFFGMIFAFAPWASVPPEDFWTGWVVATIFMVFFAIIWYLNYKSAD